MSAPLLELRGAAASYGPIQALRGVDLEVRAGEIVAVIGANGAGKTTMLMCCSGIVPLAAGAIRFAGEDLRHRPAHAIAASGLAHVPEGRKIFPRLSVLENLRLGAFTRRDRAGIAEDLERVLALFPILRERRQQPGGTLSGGEQQMLAIARALMLRPRLLLMDEPSMGVAPLLVARIFAAIRQLHAEGLSILLVEQNAQLALTTASRAYVLETGTVAMSGPAGELLVHPQVRAAYLGEAEAAGG
jgi:branched-chain amino acid transport system ATP-binding protein